MMNKCFGCYHYDSICTHGSPIFLDGVCTDYQDNEFIKQIRADEREKVLREVLRLHNNCNTDLCEYANTNISCCECIVKKLKESRNDSK